ncbi:SNF2 family N-terminal domain-containing protein [Gorgonomyces haynaldii]|nr:SNF2 family N-terminal domain-containing protein [Gorgonomyces haynaldii]
MRQRGSTEENDPEFARILNILKYYDQQSKGMTTSQEKFTQKQRDILKYQIQAFKLLSANKIVPQPLQQIIFDPQQLQDEQNGITHQVIEQAVQQAPKYTEKAPFSASAIEMFTKPTTLQEYQQRVLVPSVLPHPIDPVALRQERERFLKNRIEYRIQELSNLPTTVTEENSAKIKALIELKSLKLIEYQKKLRMDIAQSISKSTTLSTAVDRTAFRHYKKQSLREARQTEKQERNQRFERDKREKQKHLDYLNQITTHGQEFLNFHRNQQSKLARLGVAISRFHSNAAKEEERRIQRISQERLNALKANDEEAYMRLLDKSKDTRITHILEQTNSFLKSLTNAVEKQKSSIQEVEPTASMIKTEDDDDDEPKDYYDTAHKIKEVVTEQSSLLVGGKLKEYQIKGLQWMVSLYNNRLNGILADEMGLGKTIQTLSLITYLIEKKKQPGPYLVIVPLSTITNWVLEFEKWAPSVTKIVYKGSPNDRRYLGAQVRQGNFNVLLTTYEYIINPKDRPVLCRMKWVHIIIDEGHRMKNANSKLSTTLIQYYSSRYRLILTGTPLQNNLPELWALLNFILPKIFNSVKSFDDWFNTPFANTTGQERIELTEEEQLLIIRRLHKVLRPFLLRRLKKDVESELPDKVETIIKCPMSSLQAKLYEQIRNRKLGGESFTKKKALNNLVMQFRKVCNHPYVFDEVEEAVNPTKMTDANLYRVSGKFELLDRILPKLKVADHRVLIFFQMTQIMDIMEDYLRWKGFKYLRLDGSTKADDRTTMLKTFNSADDPPFIFLLSTRAGGLGLNLQTADTVIIYDSDWNPHQDLQAQDRAHRIGQKKEVRILRLVTTKSVEEAILARAQYKLDLDGKVIQAGKFDNKTTDREREELLRTLLGGDDDDDEDEKDKDNDGFMEDNDLNEIIARSEEELALYNRIDQERKAEELRQWQAMGNSGPAPPRLIQENELPKVFLEDTSAKSTKEVEYTGRGARQRKEIVYDDGTEEQWLNAIEDGDVDGFMQRKQKRKEEAQIRRQRRDEINAERAANGQPPLEEEDEEFEAEHGIELRDPEEEEESPRPKKLVKEKRKGRKPKRPFADVDPNEEDPLDPSVRAAMIRVFSHIYQLVEQAEDVQEEYTRGRSELFWSLPDKTTYADYYVIIKDPIAMDMIKARINSAYYKSVDQFKQDFDLMFSNAQTYNQEGSLVWQDAQVLRQLVHEQLSQHCPNGQVQVSEEDRQNGKRKRPNQIESEDDDYAAKVMRQDE